MGFTFTGTAKTKPKTKTTSGSSENWGMGFLLVFFPEEQSNNGSSNSNSNSKANLVLPSSSSMKLNRTNSTSRLFTKAQSTISICALLVFLTLLLFTLSTFEPTSSSVHLPRRRFLSSSQPHQHPKPNNRHLSGFLNNILLKTASFRAGVKASRNSFALQRMGVLYRRGTKAMPDLVVAHLTEDVRENELRLFLRLLHRSGVTAKADVAFLLASTSSSDFDSVLREENDSFLKLVQQYKIENENQTTTTAADSVLSFDLTQFVKAVKKNSSKEVGDPIWGKKIRGNYSSNSSTVEEGANDVLTRVSYGSIVGFEVSELDPENSLAGFLDHVPMSLRRWACYPMLLGRVRRNFKHVALVDLKRLLLLGDPLGRVRCMSPESVHVLLKSSSSSDNRHVKRNSDKTHPHPSVNSAIITGGARGVRRLANSMLTEIVRAAMQHKKKSSVTESGVLSQLVGNEHVLKNINLVTSTESIPDASSVTGSSSKSPALVQRGGGNGNSNHDADYSRIMRIICSCELDSSVYKNC